MKPRSLLPTQEQAFAILMENDAPMMKRLGITSPKQMPKRQKDIQEIIEQELAIRKMWHRMDNFDSNFF